MAEDLTEEEQRQYWRLRWLSSLQAFADSSLQASRWTDPDEDNPHYSFVECMCSYFDDADLGDADSYEQRILRGHLSSGEAATVDRFHTLASAYEAPDGDDYDAMKILADPAWSAVVESAQHAQSQLLSLLHDEAELAALTKPVRFEKRGAGHYQGHWPG